MRTTLSTHGLGTDPYPKASALVRTLRAVPEVERFLAERLRLGSEAMRDLGNLYTAALPAWLAAGFDEAARGTDELAGKRMLALGYGSGDAAEALPFVVQPGWREAARRIHFDDALAGAVTLDRAQYEARHDGREVDLGVTPRGELAIERVGTRTTGDAQDVGVEYYAFVP